ncbi:hypothetical protein I79_023585 [Cricetulus griseus]|nr:hypothetical protein I79_014916 [Cricetulus griseus]EGW15023.1 hypothetical protein I79_023585 [Cricetulus griseus]
MDTPIPLRDYLPYSMHSALQNSPVFLGVHTCHPFSTYDNPSCMKVLSFVGVGHM